MKRLIVVITALLSSTMLVLAQQGTPVSPQFSFGPIAGSVLPICLQTGIGKTCFGSLSYSAGLWNVTVNSTAVRGVPADAMSRQLLNSVTALTNQQLSDLEPVYPEQFRSAGQDDATAIQAALTFAAGLNKKLVIPAKAASAAYAISGPITIPSHARIDATGAKFILNAGVNHAIFTSAGASDIVLKGGDYNGNKTSNTASDPIIFLQCGSDITVDAVTVHDGGLDGLRTQCSSGTMSRVRIVNSVAYSNGIAAGSSPGNGITLDATTDDFLISLNFAWGNASHGIGIVGVATNGEISLNNSSDNDPSHNFADSFTGYNQFNSNLKIIGNTCKNGGNHCFHFGGSHIQYIGNSANGAYLNGFLHGNQYGTISTDVSFASNTASGALRECFELDNVNVATLTSNTASDCGQRGYLFYNSSGITATSNTARHNTLDGFRTDGTGLISGNDSFGDNISVNNGGSGLFVAHSLGTTVIGNTLNGNTNYGFAEGAGNLPNTLVLAYNDLRGNTAGSLTYVSFANFQRLESNTGYTRGGTGAVTVGASPFTYVAGPSEEAISIRGGTVTNITVNGQTLYDASNVVIPLAANDTLTMTYTGSPTLIRIVH